MIYIMVAFGGEYEDAWERNELASTDETALQTIVNERNLAAEKLVRTCKEFSAHLQAFRAFKLNGRWDKDALVEEGNRWLAEHKLTQDEVNEGANATRYRIDEVPLL